MAISNKYKHILDDFIDNLDLKSLLKSIDKKFYNAPRFKVNSTSLFKEDCLNKNVLASDRLSQLAPKSRNIKLHQRQDFALFDSKSERAQYEKD